MTKVLLGPTISEARGSTGGTKFSRNRHGAYIAPRVKPVDPASARQLAVRNDFASLASQWSSVLTTAQRTAWNLYAASVPWIDGLGQPTYLTGYNMFLRSNMAILSAGGTVVADGPTIFSLPASDPAFVPSATETAQQISVAFDDQLAWANEDGGWMLISQSQPRIGSREYIGGPYRIGGSIEGDSITPPTTPALITCPFAVAESQKIEVVARIIRADGRVSGPFRDTITVAA